MVIPIVSYSSEIWVLKKRIETELKHQKIYQGVKCIMPLDKYTNVEVRTTFKYG